VLALINHFSGTKMQLVPYTRDGLELVIDTQTGESFASISAVARMTDKDKQLINHYVNGGLHSVKKMELKTAEIQTPVGIRSVKLLNEDQILQVVSKYNPSLLIKFAQCGLRVFLHQLAGYSVVSTAVEQIPPKTRRELAEEALKLIIELEEKEALIASLEEDVERQAEVIDELFDYSSIIRIAKYNGVPETTFNWRVLKIASTNLKAEIKKVPCPRFETKSLYSHDAWRLAYPGFKLPETTTLVINPQ
jgi:hypothetical protein